MRLAPPRVRALALASPLAAVMALGSAGSKPIADTATAGPGRVDVTVHEGTSMAIAVSPDRRHVAIDLQGGLWIVPIEGGTARRVTDEYGDVRQPDWSPDGQRIAFQSYRDGTWRIWTVRPDGSDLRAVTSGPHDDREPHWSPDGKSITFSSDRSGNYDVWTMDVESGAVRQVTRDPGNDFFPAWSRDGSQIAFVSTRPGTPGVYVTTLDGVERQAAQVWDTVGAPSWSPTGTIVYAAVPTPPGPAAGAAPPPGTPTRPARIVAGEQVIATGEDYFPFRAQWLSPTEFLYPADGRIKRRSIETGSVSTVPFSATLAVTPARYRRKPRDFDSASPRPALGILRPVQSPDGSRLAFAALGDIWIQSSGGEPARLTNDEFVDTDPAWSPDGRWIAFSSDRAGSLDIWIRDLESGREQRLTTSTDADVAPAWSPDGTTIAYVANQAYKQGELHVVSAAGGAPRRLRERGFGLGYPSWAPDGRAIVVSALRAYSTRYREGMNHFWVVPVDGGAATLHAPTVHRPSGKRAADGPAVAPDRRHIAYVSDGRLFVQSIDATLAPVGTPRALGSELADSISWAGPGHILYIATDRLRRIAIADGVAVDVPLAVTWRPVIPAGRLVIHAGRLIDGVRPVAQPDVDIIVDGHRITSVVAHDEAYHTGRLVDASGLTVFPGLIEGHGHTLIDHGRLFGRVHLAYGVTSVRDVGSLPYEALESREAFESGRRPGPRLFTSGYLLDGARPYYPMASTAPDEDVVTLEVERARRLGYDTFKTYVRLPDLLQRSAIEGAHANGIPVSSHEIYPAALSGADSVEHTGATSRRGYSTKQSLSGRAYEDVVQILAKSRMTITPTLGLGGFQTGVAREPALIDDPRWRLLQPAWTDALVRSRLATSRPAGGLTAGQRTVAALHRAGVRLIAGVDSPLAPYATALHVELEDYVAAGLTTFEALQTATRNTAALLGADRDLGTIEAGKLADLVIVDGNPLDDIRHTRRVRTVVKNGEVFTLARLLELGGQ